MIPNELIIAIKANIDDLMSNLKKGQKAIEGFGRGADLPKFRQDMRAAERYAGVFGNTLGATTKKMGFLDDEIRRLTEGGLNKNAGAVKALKEEYDRLAKSGGATAQLGRLFDSFTGGKLSQTTNILSGMGVNLGAVGSKAGVVGVAIAALGVIWKQAVVPGMEFNAMLEQQETAFKVMLGSANNAADMMNELKTLSMTTPIGFAEGATSAKQLIAYGFAQKEIVGNMKMLATLASATGTSISELTYVYGTLRAQGRAYTRDLMQFGMRGIPIYEYLAKTLKVSVKEIKNLTEEGKIGFAEVEAAIQSMTGEGGKFNGLLEESMKTLTGLKTIMKNTFQMGTAEAVKSLMPIFKALTKTFTNLFIGVKPILETIVGVIAAIMVVLQPVFDIIAIIVQAVGVLFSTFNAIVRTIGQIKIAGQPIVDMFLSWMSPLSAVSKWLSNIIKQIDSIARTTLGGAGAVEKFDVTKFTTNIIKNQAVKRYLTDDLRKQLISGIVTIPEMVTKKVKWEELGKVDQERYLTAWRQGADWDTPGWVAKQKAGLFDLTVEQMTPQWKDWLPSTQLIQEVQKKMNDMNDDVSYSWDETIAAIFAALPEEARQAMDVTKEEIMTLIEAGETMSVHFWDTFVREGASGAIPVLTREIKESGFASAQEYVKPFRDAIALVIAKGKEVGDSQEEIAASVSDEAKKAFDVLNKDVDVLLRMAKSYMDDAQFQAFKKAIIDARNEFKGLIQDGTGAAKASEAFLNDILAYMKFRADAMNLESDALYMQLQYYTGISELGAEQTDYLERQLALIEYQYALEESALIAAYNKGELDLNELTVKASITNEMREQEKIRAKLNEGQRLYNKQLEGNKEYWEQLQSDMGYAAERGDYASYAGMAAINATHGTEVGSLIANGDPMAMAITAFVDMLSSIENVGKVLNPFKTALEGTKNIIEGPLNAALKPLVDALVSVGELLGVVLLPIIDLMSSAIGALFGWIKPLFTIFSKFYEALRPLITLFIKLANPIYFLFDILNQLFIALGAIVDSVAGQAEDLEDLFDKQVKSLQDLYQVGAISGQEYERRLAMLKGGVAESQTSSLFNDQLRDVFTRLFEALDEMGGAIQQLLDALLSVIWPVLEPALMVLSSVLGALAGFLTMVSGTFTGIAATIKAFVDFFMGKLSWTDAVAAMAAGWRTFLDGLNSFINFLIEGINQLINWPLKDISWRAAFAEGTPNIPTDMIAQVHEGEMIIPSTFAESLRKGDLSLSKKQQEGGTTIVNNYYVEGSVITERELYKKTGANMMKLRKLGYA